MQDIRDRLGSKERSVKAVSKRARKRGQSRVVKGRLKQTAASEKKGGLVGSHRLGRKIYQLEVL
jgi:hypothetical protein